MTSKVWVFLAVTLVSIGAGVAVAGIPEGRSTELSDVISVPPLEPEAATPETTASDEPEPSSTTESTSPPITTPTTEAPTTEAPPETAPDTSASPETTPTTQPESATSTSVVEESAPTTRVAVDRLELSIVVANGASIAGAAGDIAERLEDAGYPNVRTLDGTEIVAASAVFAESGLQVEAERLATDLGIDPGLVFPMNSAPELFGDFDEPLLVYLGTDVINLT